MKREIREVIEAVDQTARSAGVPTYSELVKIILDGQRLMPHTSPLRKMWVQRVIEAINQIHKEK